MKNHGKGSFFLQTVSAQKLPVLLRRHHGPFSRWLPAHFLITIRIYYSLLHVVLQNHYRHLQGHSTASAPGAAALQHCQTGCTGRIHTADTSQGGPNLSCPCRWNTSRSLKEKTSLNLRFDHIPKSLQTSSKKKKELGKIPKSQLTLQFGCSHFRVGLPVRLSPLSQYELFVSEVDLTWYSHV